MSKVNGQYNTSQFVYDPVAKTFTAGFSKLMGFDYNGARDGLFAGYNFGASEQQLVMISEESGQSATFIIYQIGGGRQKKDGNHAHNASDHWILEPTAESLTKFPGLKDHKVIIKSLE